MKKHISLVIVFSILLLALISIGPPVKAKQEIQQTEYEAIDIYGNQLPNSKYQNGLYEKGLLISPYDFIFTDLNEEQKEKNGQEIKPDAEGVRSISPQQTDDAPQIRSPVNERNPTGNIIGDHVIIGRSGFQLKNKNRSKGIKI